MKSPRQLARGLYPRLRGEDAGGSFTETFGLPPLARGSTCKTKASRRRGHGGRGEADPLTVVFGPRLAAPLAGPLSPARNLVPKPTLAQKQH